MILNFLNPYEKIRSKYISQTLEAIKILILSLVDGTGIDIDFIN